MWERFVMTKRCADLVLVANSALSEAGATSPRSGDANSAVLDVLRALLGPKPWTILVDWFGLSNGAARKKMYGERELSTDELATLLRSEHGREVLAALMGDAQPRWWRALNAQMLLIDSKQESYRARRRLREAMDVADDIEDEIDQAETALVLRGENRDRLDSDFDRPRNRAVAPAPQAHGGRIGRKSR